MSPLHLARRQTWWGVNQPVELTVNLSYSTIPLPSFCPTCILDQQGATGTVTIADGQGNSQLFHLSHPFAFFSGAAFTFETTYAFLGNYVATYNASITVGGSILFPPCEGSPGVTCPRNTTLFFTYDLSGSTPVLVTPLPAALPLFATGLGVCGLFGWRRKRKAMA